MRRVLSLILLFIFLPVAAFADLTIYFLDVGQGDATLILADDEAMIIDGGPPGASGFLPHCSR